MTCSKSEANALGLSKQDKTNCTCFDDIVNKITEIMTCSKSRANASGSFKRNDTDGV